MITDDGCLPDAQDVAIWLESNKDKVAIVDTLNQKTFEVERTVHSLKNKSQKEGIIIMVKKYEG